MLLGLLGGWQPGQAADFTCPAGDVACLKAAITTANANGETNTITLVAGTYTLTTVDNTTNGANGLPSITSKLTIRGAGVDTTIIERDASAPRFRLLHVSADSVLQLESLTVRGGSADNGDGGGILNFGDVQITYSRVTNNNSADTGGGVSNHGGTVTIAHSLFADNLADAGGGVSNDGGGLRNEAGTVEITDSSFLGNSSAHPGGAIWNCGTATITTSTFIRNSADGGIIDSFCFEPPQAPTTTIMHTTVTDSQGGLFGVGLANNGTMLVLNSAIVRNVANVSAAGIGNSGTLTVLNTTIAANRSLDGGGSIGNSGVLTLINTTVADNRGGGLRNHGTAVVVNTILARNSGDPLRDVGADCSGVVTSQGHNLLGDLTGCTLTLHPSDLTGDPGLGRLLDPGTPGQAHVPLLATSRAINAGDPQVCAETPELATDQLGTPRGGVCDIGAIEFRPESVPVNALVAFEPIPSTFAFTPDATGCPGGEVGTFRFEARLTNIRERSLSDLVIAVIELTGLNLLQNADSGPGGVGTNMTVPRQEGFSDGVLRPHEFVDVPFIICLLQQEPFRFFVDVLGKEQ
jgi:hypothetical protein